MAARAVAVATFVVLFAAVFGQSSARAVGGQTIVSITFDDGVADQMLSLPVLSSHNMVATYYLNSARTGGDPAYMTWANIAQLSSAGNEIAGHTSYHEDLTAIDPVEAQREICYDRVNLITHGYNVTDFAYPFGDNNAAIQADVQQCGYATARTVQDFTGPPFSGTNTPPNPYALQIGTASSTITALEHAVQLAEQNGGGWVPLVFHHICNSCDPDYITQGDFSTFVNWLAGEVTAGRVVTQTVHQFLGGTFNPPVAGPALPAAVNGANGLKNSSFEIDVNGDQIPDCWNTDDFGNNSFQWSRTTDAHSGTYADNLVVSSYHDGDNKLDGVVDLGFCQPTVTPGRQYLITEWYKSSAPTYFTVFSRADSTYQQSFWTSSPTFPATSTWTKATWVTPAVPTGVNGINFGLTLGGNGSLTVDDISLTDNNQTSGPDTTAPTVSLTSPSGGQVSGNVQISATASDNVTVDHLDFLVDGNIVGSTMTPPYSFNWNSHSISNGSHTISVRAVDTAGNARTTTPVAVTVSNQNTNLLSNPGLESGSGNTPTCWQLAGYGTNTATWTWTSDSHGGSAAENLNISAYTNGDRKLLTQFNTCSVTVIPGHSYTISAWYKSSTAKPSIFTFLSSTGPTGSYNFLANSPQQPVSANWTQVVWSTPVLAAGATNLSVGLGLTGQAGSLTMDDFSMTDNAPQADTTAPTSEILCNGGGENSGCQTGYYSAPVQVTLSAVDNNGGSGVSKIVYTTDGSTPTATNGSTYGGGFLVSQTATVKFRAIDNAGNLEPVNSQPILIDTTPPTASILCNGNGCSSFFSSAVSVTLSTTDTGGSGAGEIFYTTDGTDPGPMNGNFYLGSFSVSQSSTVKFIAYDAAGNESQIYSQAIQVDTTAPVSVIRCGGIACQPTPYNASVLVSFNSSDAGSGVSSVFYTTDGSTPTQTNGNVYLAPFSLPATATVRYRALDNAGNLEPVNSQTITIDATPPTVSLTAPSAGSSLKGAVGLTASASDNVAVAHVDFLVDGSVVSTDDTAPYSFSWNSASVADGTHTLNARAVDTAGNPTTSSGVSVTTDQVAPSTTISCNSAVCQSSPYSSAVTISMAATDPTPGSGVAATVYTTDGTDPTLANGNFYTAPFNVSTTKTVKFRSFDVAGNAEQVQTQTITITQESVTLTAPTDGSTVSGTTVSFAATVSGGSADHVDFLVDGTIVGSSSSAPYTFSWDSTIVADGQHTVKAEAVGASTVDSPVATVTVSNNGPPPPDTIPPTSTISCNGAACQIDAYSNPVSVTLAATDNPGGSGVAEIIYTTDGTAPTLTNGTAYTAPFGVQTTTTVEYRAYDVAGNQEAANVQTINIDLSSTGINLTAPSTGDVLTDTVPISATVTGLTPDRVDFLVDGTVVGSVGTAPYTFSWDSTSVADGPHSIKAQAVSGSTVTDSNTASVTVQNNTAPPPDTTPPTSQISCNFLDCTPGFYASAVSVTLTATDNAGGSGVAEIRYTTDGTTPTATHGLVYGGSFSVPATTTVLYRAFDNAGNAEAVNSQWIEIDTTAPSSTVKCNATTCAGTFYNAPVQISLTGSDNTGGSGLNEIVYTTDGSDPTATNGSVYSAPFTLSATTNLRYRAIDNTGNLEPVNAAQLQIDVTAPTTSILCAGSACTTSHPYQAGTQISFPASDGSGGSGVAQTRYTTDGTVPTKTTGLIYTAPFAISATTTFHFRSYDTVGNLEADHVVQVQVDGTPPTVSLTAPAANSQAAGQVTLSANASDNVGISKVDFLVDGNVVGTATSAPYSYSWASGSVSDGVHTVAARATDTAGNTATTAAINVTTTNTNLLQNPGLETGSGNTPSCWTLAGYGTNTPAWTWTTDAHTGSKAENLTVTGYTNGDRKMLQSFNATCATATSAGHGFTITVWYKSTAPSTIFEFGSTTGATGTYNWLAQSPVLPVAASWTLASWTTPTVPAGVTNISTGMGMQNAGSLTMDDFGLFQTK